MIVINVEREKIQWKPVQTKTGVRHFANLVVDNLKEVDEKENTHSVYNNQSKEQRAEKAKKEYCGRGKEYNFEKKEYSKPVNKQEEEDLNSLPF
jgi:hypothetical protein